MALRLLPRWGSGSAQVRRRRKSDLNPLAGGEWLDGGQ